MAKRNGSLAVKQQPTKPLTPKNAGSKRLADQTQESNELNALIKPTEIEFLTALKTGESFDPKNPTTSLFKHTIAITKPVWDQCLKIPARLGSQDFEHALWNILWALKIAVERSSGGSAVTYSVSLQTKRYQAKIIKLKARCGTFATPVPLIKIMTPTEDGTAS